MMSRPSYAIADQTNHQILSELTHPFKGEHEPYPAGVGDISSQYESHRSLDIHGVSPTLSSTGLFNNQARLENLPYGEAIKCFERIQTFQSPREKL